jgi:hypothetical protein
MNLNPIGLVSFSKNLLPFRGRENKKSKINIGIGKENKKYLNK